MFEYKKIVEEIDLGKYGEVYAGRKVFVWVNLPKAMKQRRLDILKALYPSLSTKFLRRLWLRLSIKNAQRKLFEWLSELWSQGDDKAEHWSTDEVLALFENEPTLYHWLVRESALLIDAFDAGKKK